MNIAERLDDILPVYWKAWRDWHYEQGWRLGPDRPAALLSPFMVDSFDQLRDVDQAWFKTHVIFVVHAIQQLEPTSTVAAPTPPTQPAQPSAKKKKKAKKTKKAEKEIVAAPVTVPLDAVAAKKRRKFGDLRPRNLAVGI